MIIMINGAFGVGKTSVAEELTRTIENSMLFDPEEVGFMLRNLIPEDIRILEAKTGDFQDLELWRVLTVKVAGELRRKYNKTLIVPMTIRKKEYFQYIFNGFRGIDDATYHFCLTADKETIFERLRKRGEEEGNWCFQQTQKCLEAYKDECFRDFIKTDESSISQIVETIKSKLKFIAL